MGTHRFPLHPLRLLDALDAIDRDWRDTTIEGWQRPAAVLVTAAVCLLGIHYLKYFFRGFMLETLAPRLGAGAIFVMAVPYMMIHLSKPWPEAAGAIAFGILLGILALRSRSIWGGALVHVTIALSMDLMSLAQTGRWPAQGWPG